VPDSTTPEPDERRSALRVTLDVLGRRSLAVAVGLALVAAIAGFGYAGTREPSYVASAATLLDQPLVLGASRDAGVVDKLSRLRLKYAGILRSDDVLVPVAQELDEEQGDLFESIVTGNDPASLLLFVGARDSTPEGAIRRANALATGLSAYVDREQATLAPRDRVKLKVVAPAREEVQLLPTPRQQLVAGLGSGLVVLVIALGAGELLRRRRA
jgi:capsular polysaccharide biosynthesis protein